ncbi:MAG: acyl-CoA dehydrogenase family protein [Ilumatobacteraceae bacterium]
MSGTRRSGPFDPRTDRQRELVGIAAELGVAFAKRAERYDREASFPYENFADLRDAGFLTLAVPERFGGLGADFVTYAMIAEEIGRHCGSTALTFNMHTATCLIAGPIADELGLTGDDADVLEQRRTGLFEGVVEQHRIHSQPFSEGLSGRATTGVATVATPVDGGYLVSGRKIFASLSEAADVHNVVCLVPGDDRIRLLGVAAGSPGLTVTGDWDPLGMRGTISKTLILEEVFVPADHEWIPPGVFDQVAARYPWFYMTLSFAYLGLMKSVLDITGSYLRGEIDGSARGHHPQKQHVWAEMNLLYDRTRSLTYAVLDRVAVDPHPDDVRLAWSSMVATMEGAPELASLAIRACGGRSLLRPLPLERLYRDARCGATMLPWSAEVCLERLGQYGLVDGDGSFA